MVSLDILSLFGQEMDQTALNSQIKQLIASLKTLSSETAATVYDQEKLASVIDVVVRKLIQAEFVRSNLPATGFSNDFTKETRYSLFSEYSIINQTCELIIRALQNDYFPAATMINEQKNTVREEYRAAFERISTAHPLVKPSDGEFLSDEEMKANSLTKSLIIKEFVVLTNPTTQVL